MVTRRRVALWAVAVAGLTLAATGIRLGAQQQYVRGQNIQPAYEGWDRNPDGSYNVYFGYFNRNGEEEPDVEIGTANSFSPGPADRGQPTHFYARRQQFVFKVRVPADFGKQELTWTVTHNGRTDRAVAWLAPFYELDNTVLRAQRGGSQRQSTQAELDAKPPSIEVDGQDTVTVPVDSPVTLAVLAKDDGLPGPARQRRFESEEGGPQAAQQPEVLFRPPQRISFPATDKVSAASAAKTGLAVSWLHYRGNGAVTFEPATSPLEKTGGRATTTARFSAPGTYVVRAVANDQIFTAPVNITVTVTPRASAQR